MQIGMQIEFLPQHGTLIMNSHVFNGTIVSPSAPAATATIEI
jgi:hypothetical protein